MPPSAGSSWRDAVAYLPAQVVGCIGGAVVANLMFSQAAVSISTHHRASPAHFLSEVVATLGLILVIFALARSGRARTARRRPSAPTSERPTSSPARRASPTRPSRSGDVLQHLRRHRPVLGAELRCSPRCRRGTRRRSSSRCSIPTSPRPRPPTSWFRTTVRISRPRCRQRHVRPFTRRGRD